jgi:hypothetical protein
MNDIFNTTINLVRDFFAGPDALRSVLVLVLALALAYWLSNFVALIIVRLAQLVAVRSDTTNNAERQVQLRRVETYLSVIIALIRAFIVGTVAFYVWQVVEPGANSTTAAIGASTLFIVLAGGTIGLILRDVTSGAAMIIEQWFNVGDYIRVEPFMDVSGVVERVTLRSTKLRSITGEVIWLHNQQIQGVKVTPRGLRTIAVDVFANDRAAGKELIEWAIETVPVGTMKVVKQPKITRDEDWGNDIYYFTVVGEMPPGREWLMEDYFIKSLIEIDGRGRDSKVLMRPPIARYADPAAERSFKRAVKMARNTSIE